MHVVYKNRVDKKNLQEEPAVEDDNKEVANREEADNGNSATEGLASENLYCYKLCVELY